MASKKTYGLVLDLGGAAGWHQVQGVYGVFHPDEPVPVGGIGEPTYEQAKEWTADPGMPLRMVEINVKEVPELREAAAEARKGETSGEED